MRVVLQRVTEASVSVEGVVVGAIKQGFVALVGVGSGDRSEQAEALAAKTAGLRVFVDAAGKFNHALVDLGGEALVISQFTLLADVRKGRRPSFTKAAEPSIAEGLVERYAATLEEHGVRVARGRFGAKMLVQLANDGPVTIVLDSADLERPRRGGS